MDKKLTDSEIVKALEYCTNNDECDTDCPCFSEKESMCGNYNGLLKQILDLINRLQAENDRKDKIYIDLLKTSSERADIISSLKAENERLKEEIELLHSDYTYKFVKAKAKAEAYKECVEKAKNDNDYYSTDGADVRAVFDNILDNLLKELVGEGGGNK